MGTDLLDVFGTTPSENPKGKAEPGTPEDAARAVAEALRADTGRNKKIDHWKPVAAKVLQKDRLHRGRWDAVLQKGVALSLFQIDESRKYPVLIPLDPPTPPTPEEPGEDAVEVEYPEPRPEPTVPPSPHAPGPPKDPPTVLDCGHMSFFDKEDESAQAEGKCCANHKGVIHWQYLKGEFRRPVPAKLRRDHPDRVGRNLGWPGYCCDKEGFYQGGLANCHLYAHPKATPCAGCHAASRSRKVSEDDE